MKSEDFMWVLYVVVECVFGVSALTQLINGQTGLAAFVFSQRR
jgi:hypothetical protein